MDPSPSALCAPSIMYYVSAAALNIQSAPYRALQAMQPSSSDQ